MGQCIHSKQLSDKVFAVCDMIYYSCHLVLPEGFCGMWYDIL